MAGVHQPGPEIGREAAPYQKVISRRGVALQQRDAGALKQSLRAIPRPEDAGVQVEGAALGEDPTRPRAAQPDDRQMITHLSDAGVVSGEGADEPVGGGGELIQSGDHQKLIGTQPGGGHVVTRDKPIGGRRRPIQGPDRGRIDTQIQQTKTAFHG